MIQEFSKLKISVQAVNFSSLQQIISPKMKEQEFNLLEEKYIEAKQILLKIFKFMALIEYSLENYQFLEP